MDNPKTHYINPELAAHNIASAFCAHEVQKLSESAFIPGDLSANPHIRHIWNLYSNVYDSVFGMALIDNVPSTDDE